MTPSQTAVLRRAQALHGKDQLEWYANPAGDLIIEFTDGATEKRVVFRIGRRGHVYTEGGRK